MTCRPSCFPGIYNENTGMQDTFSPGARRLRVWLIAPFLALILSCVLLMLAALLSYGAADEVGYPAWAAPAGGFLYALPVLLGGAGFALAVWLRTAGPYRVKAVRVLPGAACVLAMVALTLAYVFLINDPSSYYGKFNNVTGKYDANLTLESFLSFSFLMAIFFPGGGVAVLVKVLYLDGLESIGLSKPTGPDPIGAIMSSKPFV